MLFYYYGTEGAHRPPAETQLAIEGSSSVMGVHTVHARAVPVHGQHSTARRHDTDTVTLHLYEGTNAVKLRAVTPQRVRCRSLPLYLQNDGSGGIGLLAHAVSNVVSCFGKIECNVFKQCPPLHGEINYVCSAAADELAAANPLATNSCTERTPSCTVCTSSCTVCSPPRSLASSIPSSTATAR